MSTNDSQILLEMNSKRIEKISDIISDLTADVGIIKQNIKELISSNRDNKNQIEEILKKLNNAELFITQQRKSDDYRKNAINMALTHFNKIAFMFIIIGIISINFSDYIKEAFLL